MKPLLVAALIALALPARGHAATAWVLWEKFESVTTEKGRKSQVELHWTPKFAWDVHADCESGLSGAWSSTDKDWRKYFKSSEVRSFKNFFVSSTAKSKDSVHSMTSTFYCFPDTIDPRDK